MRVWELERPIRRSDPGHLVIRCYGEVVRPRRDAERGVWIATIHRGDSRATMKREGFRVVRHPGPRAPRPTVPCSVPNRDAQACLVPVDRWLRRPRRSVERLNASEALAAQREPWEPPKHSLSRSLRGVGVVLVVTGWGDTEMLAAEMLQAELPRGCELVVVHNHPGSRDLLAGWTPSDATTVVTTDNEGFAAACNAGARALSSTVKVVLFTQADAEWSVTTLKRAVGLLRASRKAGAPIVLGPSGGLLDAEDPSVIRETGPNVRQIANEGDPVPVDFVVGYWLLVDRDRLDSAGGWDERFPLYYEDPDLCLRLTLEGVRAVQWADLAVEHRRGSTVRSLMSPAVREAIREHSRGLYLERWGPPPPPEVRAEPVFPFTDAVVVHGARFDDHRGDLAEVYRSDLLGKHRIPNRWAIMLRTRSRPGVLRGMHWQDPPQGKLIQCTRGRILDVFVDLRGDSDTYGRWGAVELAEDDDKQVWVPPGFAHGFAVLGPEEAEVIYLVDQPRNAEGERSFRWNDPEVGIEWPVSEPVLSERDAAAAPLEGRCVS